MNTSTFPSFEVLLGEANAVKAHPVAHRMFDKVACRELLLELGAPIVQRFFTLTSADQLEPSMIATPTVIKPRRGANNRGVMSLLPLGGGRWRELLGGQELDYEGVVGTMAASVLRLGVPDSWIVEDMVEGAMTGSPVDDVKLCMFGDVLACSFVRSNDPRGYRWFDADWRPVDTGVHAAHLIPGIAVPDSNRHLTEIATEISSRLPLPFVRVDFLVGQSQTVVGELTPYPGWYRDFSPEWDKLLGMHYERSTAELASSGRDITRIGPAVLA